MDGFEKQLTHLKVTENVALSDFEKIMAELNASTVSTSDKFDLLKKVQDIAFSKGIEISVPVENVSSRPEIRNMSGSESAPEEHDSRKPRYSVTLGNEDEEDTGESTSEEAQKTGSKKARISNYFNGSIRDWLRIYKRYYVFEIGNGDTSPKGPTLIYDKIPSPELIQRTLPGPNSAMSLNEFLTALEEEESDLWTMDHVCLLVLSDFSESAAQLLSKTQTFGKFENFKFYELILDDDEVRAYIYEGERLFEELKSDINISLTNANLNKAEESLIKSFFPKSPSLIQYKVLKGGFSGSKVVEVSQVFSVPRPCKYVIKIGSKKDKKISIEETAVKQWVQSLVSNYQTEKNENATHEALKYQFASVDGKRESKSFTELFNSKHIDEIRSVVGKLFNHEIFFQWEKLQFREEKPATVLDLYAPYLSLESIREKVGQIGFSKANDYMKLFSEILEKELPYSVKKVSHGDLHSENIIIDDSKVFLIDFGMTEVAHCFVDYATLEASIRLKLTPAYFPTNELEKVDEFFLKLFDISDASIDQKIQNEDLRKSMKVIAKIRQLAVEKVYGNSHTFSSTEDLELHYLISLFCISLRNIKYPDLNQKYAMTLSNHLANILVAKLSNH